MDVQRTLPSFQKLHPDKKQYCTLQVPLTQSTPNKHSALWLLVSRPSCPSRVFILYWPASTFAFKWGQATGRLGIVLLINFLAFHLGWTALRWRIFIQFLACHLGWAAYLLSSNFIYINCWLGLLLAGQLTIPLLVSQPASSWYIYKIANLLSSPGNIKQRYTFRTMGMLMLSALSIVTCDDN